MSYVLEFEIPGLPKATNAMLGRRNVRAVWGNARTWKAQVMRAIGTRKPPAPLERARLILTRLSYRTLDYDGLVASFKPVVDGLVECGVLKNDTWRITGVWEVTQEYAPKALARIRVCVESREDSPLSRPALDSRRVNEEIGPDVAAPSRKARQAKNKEDA